jgi:oligopeptide/dipeptide ABC transporter, ATP-binding protein, C-terminal domain
MSEPDLPLLSVRNLRTEFPLARGLGGRRVVKAVSDVSFDLRAGTTLGLVGESGSGKSTLARSIVGLDRPTAGSILFEGVELVGASATTRRRAGRDMQVVFQDPMASLNPRLTVGDAIAEGWRIHRDVAPRSEWKSRVAELLERVGLNPDHAGRYPHQFSGGQRQRIGIARALALRPKLLICDEAVSALDVSVRSQILNLLEDLQDEFSLTYLFIAHDLSVVRHVSDDVVVMYLGSAMEVGRGGDVFGDPVHPYTVALLSAIPPVRPWRETGRERIILTGDLPSPVSPPSGCPFRTRCWKAQEVCAEVKPPLVDHRGDGHLGACHFPEPAGSGPSVAPVP